MDHKEFDKTIREELKSEQFEWDKDLMWDAIEQELPPNKSKRIFPFWIMGSVVLLIGVLAYFLFQMNQKMDQMMAIQTQQQQIIKVLKKESITQQNYHEDIASTASKQEKNNTESTPTLSELNSNQPLKTISKTNHSQGKNTIDFKTSNISNTTITKNQTGTTTNSQSTNYSTSSSNKEALKNIESHQFSSIVDKNTMDENVSKNYTFNTVALMSINPSPILHSRINENPVTLAPYVIKQIEHHKQFGFELYGGVGFQAKKYSSNSAEFNTYSLEKEKANKALEHYRFGLRFAYQMHPNFKIASGIEYLNINELFMAMEDSISIELEQPEVGVYRSVKETSSRVVRHYNRYAQINIPILIAYTNHWKRFKYELYTGFNWNINNTISGKSITPEFRITDISKNDYKGNNVNSYFVGLKAGYPIRKNVYLNASFQYDHFLNSIAKTNANIDERYQLYGVQLGVEYLFGN